MPIAITDNEATAARRRVPLLIFADTAGTPWAGSVTGLKAQISVNGGSETASTADIVRVAGSVHYVELTQAEANRTPGDRLSVRVVATTGRLEAISFAEITADDVYAASPTDSTISTAVDAALADNFAAIPAAVWANGTRTLSSFGTLVADVTSAVWAAGTRTLTSYGSLVADTAAAVWAVSTRELTTISAGIRESIADTFLGRSIAGGANGGRTVTSAFRMTRNRQARVGAVMNYHLEDDATVFTTAAITTDTNAAPIIGLDPS